MEDTDVIPDVSSEGVATSAKLIFDSVPREAIENIIRLSSKQPCISNWTASMDPDVALKLLTSDKVLSDCFKILFPSISFQRTLPDKRFFTVQISKQDDQAKGQFQNLMSLLKTSISNISMDWDVTPDSLILTACSGIKSLALYSVKEDTVLPLSEILWTTRYSLECFEIRKCTLLEDEVEAISRFGKRLLTFSLEVGEIKNNLGSMWKSLTRLEDVSICPPEQGPNLNLKSLGQNCKRISRVRLMNMLTSTHGDIESLCEELGRSLKAFEYNATNDVYKINAQRLARIAQNRRNFSVTLSEQYGCSRDKLLAIEACAHRVNIGRRTILTAAENEEAHRAPRFQALANISLDEFITESNLREVLRPPMPQLLEFTADCENQLESSFVFQALSRCGSPLEKFKFRGLLPKACVLESFADQMHQLKIVALIDLREKCPCKTGEGLDEQQPHLAAGWRSTAKSFLHCKDIQELSLSTQNRNCGLRHESYANECLCARLRRISISICGFQYS